jgi:hypothetical protein
MQIVLARVALLFVLFCGLAGAPAYEIYASTNCEAVETIADEWEEAVLEESVSKRLPARLDMLRSPTGSPLTAGILSSRRRRLPPTPAPLTSLPPSHLNLPDVLHKFRI